MRFILALISYNALCAKRFPMDTRIMKLLGSFDFLGRGRFIISLHLLLIPPFFAKQFSFSLHFFIFINKFFIFSDSLVYNLFFFSLFFLLFNFLDTFIFFQMFLIFFSFYFYFDTHHCLKSNCLSFEIQSPYLHMLGHCNVS